MAGIFGWQLDSHDLLCGSSKSVSILAEYHPRRLTDLPPLTENRAL
jgi:hypothetical protein